MGTGSRICSRASGAAARSASADSSSGWACERTLGLDPGQVGRDLAVDLGVVPAEHRRDQLGDRWAQLDAAVRVSIEIRVRRASTSSRCSAPSCVAA